MIASFNVLFFFNHLENPSNQQADDIYELLGRSINQLVKYFDEPEKKVTTISMHRNYHGTEMDCLAWTSHTNSLW